jgi:hypothetical protein
MASDFIKEFISINVMHNMFSNTYFLSYVCNNSMKPIHKINFFVQTCFLVQGNLIFGIIFHLGKYSSTLKK